jgi:hypothetical protein
MDRHVEMEFGRGGHLDESTLVNGA